MRISDWSSDVCSSDLPSAAARARAETSPPRDSRQDCICSTSHRRSPSEERSERTTLPGDPAMSRQALIRRFKREGCAPRSEEHTSELQSLMRISYAVFCLKKKHTKTHVEKRITTQQQHRYSTKQNTTNKHT